jgi:hypothetical protein
MELWLDVHVCMLSMQMVHAKVNFAIWAMAEAAGHKPIIVKARVQSQTSPCGVAEFKK